MQELTIHLDPKSNLPLYEQIYAYIKGEIQKNRIKAGEKLPSSRALSAYLEVSRSTVDLAYGQLMSEGYLESVPCKGYYACSIRELYHLTAFSEPVLSIRPKKSRDCAYDLTPNGIDLDSFPFGVWRKITRNILIDDKKELFQLGDPQGEWELRETIATYLHQARGVICGPEQIVLGAGNDYLLMLLSTLLGREHCIAMETPTYKHAYQIFQELGIFLVTVPVDARGMEISALRASGADIAYVMPSHQYPLGIVMPIKRRLELLEWAGEKEGRYIIEDDYDSEFRYKGKPIPALQGSDSRGRVIYIGTFSKSIAPAIRISYMVLPGKLLQECRGKLHHFSSTVSRLDQMVLNSFIKEGYYERHLNRMRTIYGRKHDILLGAMKRLSDSCRVLGENAGVHFLIEFAKDRSEEEIIRQAEKEGVRVYPLSEYCIEGQRQKDNPAVILGYATLSEEALAQASDRLVKAWGNRKTENS